MRINDIKQVKTLNQVVHETIKVDDHKLVATLMDMGFLMPVRYVGITSEQIDEDHFDNVIDQSVFLYPRSQKLLLALDKIERHGHEIDAAVWEDYMDALKLHYGVEPSTKENFHSANYKHPSVKTPSTEYQVGL